MSQASSEVKGIGVNGKRIGGLFDPVSGTRTVVCSPVLMALMFIAILIGTVLPAPVSAETLLAVTTNNELLRFDSATPNNIISTTAITGLQAGEFIEGIDFRPATGQLFALSSDSRLYTVNQTTGEVTQVGADGAFTLSGTDFGFDFNPVPDRIRVVSDAEQNLRLNPNDGTPHGDRP